MRLYDLSRAHEASFRFDRSSSENETRRDETRRKKERDEQKRRRPPGHQQKGEKRNKPARGYGGRKRARAWGGGGKKGVGGGDDEVCRLCEQDSEHKPPSKCLQSKCRICCTNQSGGDAGDHQKPKKGIKKCLQTNNRPVSLLLCVFFLSFLFALHFGVGLS